MKNLKLFGLGIALIPLFLIALSTNPLKAQGWQKTFDLGAQRQQGISMTESPDGNYVLAGFTRDPVTPDNSQVFVLATNTDGELLWQKLIDIQLAGEKWVSQIRKAKDNSGYYISGQQHSPNDTTIAFLVKTDLEGTLLSVFNIENLNRINDFEETANGDLLLAGGVFDENMAGLNHSIAKLVRIDPTGNLIWEKAYLYAEYFYDILPAGDGNYLLAGQSESGQLPLVAQVAIAIKVDGLGDEIWNFAQNPDPYFNRSAEKIMINNEGHILLAAFGFSASFNGTLVEVIDPEGSPVTTKYIQSDVGTKLDFTYCSQSDAILTAGYQPGNNGPDLQLAQIDADGSISWSTSSQLANDDRGHGIALTSDGSILSVGYATEDNRELVLLVKSENTCEMATPTVEFPLSKASVSVSPNPAFQSTNFMVKTSLSPPFQLVVYDGQGVAVSKQQMQNNALEWSRGRLPSGMYYYQLFNDNQVVDRGKLLLK